MRQVRHGPAPSRNGTALCDRTGSSAKGVPGAGARSAGWLRPEPGSRAWLIRVLRPTLLQQLPMHADDGADTTALPRAYVPRRAPRTESAIAPQIGTAGRSQCPARRQPARRSASERTGLGARTDLGARANYRGNCLRGSVARAIKA